MLSHKHLICPTCDSQSFRVAISKTMLSRVIIDCSKCDTRCSIPVESYDYSSNMKTTWSYLKFSEEYDVTN